MTARFRSAFSGSSGFVAVRPQARVVAEVPARDRHAPAQPHAGPACQRSKTA